MTRPDDRDTTPEGIAPRLRARPDCPDVDEAALAGLGRVGRRITLRGTRHTERDAWRWNAEGARMARALRRLETRLATLDGETARDVLQGRKTVDEAEAARSSPRR